MSARHRRKRYLKKLKEKALETKKYVSDTIKVEKHIRGCKHCKIHADTMKACVLTSRHIEKPRNISSWYNKHVDTCEICLVAKAEINKHVKEVFPNISIKKESEENVAIS